MFPFGSRPSPPPLLPRPVPPFPGEATGSYLYRLARANELHPPDLRAHLAGQREHGPVSPGALAAATGRPRHALSWALPELRPGAGSELSGYIRRTVCWRCAARRDSYPYAAVWQPAETCLCLSHRIWLGSAAHPRLRRQDDIAGLPEIIQAQGRHSRLARRRGRQTAIAAIAEASRITALWARHGFYRDRRIPLIRELRGKVPITGKLPSFDDITAVVTYPETVDLARILAMPRWRSPAVATAGDLQQFEREVRSRTGIEYAGVTAATTRCSAGSRSTAKPPARQDAASSWARDSSTCLNFSETRPREPLPASLIYLRHRRPGPPSCLIFSETGQVHVPRSVTISGC